MKFVHAADLHLDSPMVGLRRYEGAPVEEIRAATRRALENLVELCIAERAELLLLAGDLYDGDWRDYSTGLFFAAQMSRLREASVRVVWIRGNHDAASQITRHLRLPEGMHELSPLEPATCTLEDLGVAVHGQGFAKRAITADLAATYPEPIPGLFNIGLLHTCLTGRVGHDPYAPCTTEALVNRGYAYWALGHVHRREIVCSDPWIVFPGNLQGRHAREVGDKGATLVTVQDGAVSRVDHVALDVVRFCRSEIDLSDLGSPDDMLEHARRLLERAAAAAEGRTLAARIALVGSGALQQRLEADPERWENEVRVLATDLGGYGVWLERLDFVPGPLASDPTTQGAEVLQRLLGSMHRLRREPRALEALMSELGPLRSKLPPEVRAAPDGEGLRLDSPSALGALLDDAERLLRSKLVPADERS